MRAGVKEGDRIIKVSAPPLLAGTCALLPRCRGHRGGGGAPGVGVGPQGHRPGVRCRQRGQPLGAPSSAFLDSKQPGFGLGFYFSHSFNEQQNDS